MLTEQRQKEALEAVLSWQKECGADMKKALATAQELLQQSSTKEERQFRKLLMYTTAYSCETPLKIALQMQEKTK